MTDPALSALLAEAATQLEGAAAVPTGQGTDYYLDDFLFASLAGGVSEFRLRDEVGVAALRTQDTAPSPRGAGWVRFAPKRLDGHARDRALAWFESAWRRADAELSGVPYADDDDEDGPDDDEDGPDDDEDGPDDDEDRPAGDEDARDSRAADRTASPTVDDIGED
jgi:hypothetical protein